MIIETVAYIMKRTMIGIDSELGQELRQYAERKHGTLFGAVKLEAENAIRHYIGKEKTNES